MAQQSGRIDSWYAAGEYAHKVTGACLFMTSACLCSNRLTCDRARERQPREDLGIANFSLQLAPSPALRFASRPHLAGRAGLTHTSAVWTRALVLGGRHRQQRAAGALQHCNEHQVGWLFECKSAMRACSALRPRPASAAQCMFVVCACSALTPRPRPRPAQRKDSCWQQSMA